MSIKSGIPEVPMHLDPATRRFLTALRNNVHALTAGLAPPQTVTNLSAVPIPGGNRVRFSRGDAEYYVVYVSSSPDLTKAQAYDLGVSNQYDDLDGQGGVKKYYWVRSKKFGVADSIAVGPVSSTSNAPGTPIAVPAPPPVARIITTDESTGNQVPISYAGGTPQKDL